jgi:hypothetical protein
MPLCNRTSDAWRPLAVGLVLFATVACASLSREPAHLLDQGRAALDRREYETAYSTFKELRTRYPRRPESDEAFGPACAAFKAAYYRNRHTKPEWVTSESAFMFQWLEGYFDQPGFPREQVEQLLLRMPYPLFAGFISYARTRPNLAQWVLHEQDDNGIVQTITAEPAAHEQGKGS